MAITYDMPYTKGDAVTPSDTVDVAGVGLIRAVYVGGAGTLAVRFSRAPTTTVTLTVAAGAILPIRPKRVMATGTTATGVVALS